MRCRKKCRGYGNCRWENILEVSCRYYSDSSVIVLLGRNKEEEISKDNKTSQPHHAPSKVAMTLRFTVW